MPIVTTIMVLTNVGLQLFNSMRGSNSNEELRKKRDEFQQASIERNHDRMMQLLREGQAIQEEMELSMHKDRIDNIQEDFDGLIARIFQQKALQSWPLRVLPMVMKNQSLGSYRTISDEKIALHVIFTPSNCPNFNENVFPQIEQGLEVFMSRHWNSLSSHPILFYSGAWRTDMAPTNNEIEQLRADLPHLPVLMITPFFQPDDRKLVFNIHMWGMGESQDVVIQPTDKELSYYNIYAPNMKYGEDIASTTIEEFVPYLQCMIGYLADVYFWSAHGVAPILPSLLTMGAVNTDGMKYLLSSSQERYAQLVEGVWKEKYAVFTAPNTLLSLEGGYSAFLEKDTTKQHLDNVFLRYCDMRSPQTKYTRIEDAIKGDFWTIDDEKFITNFINVYPDGIIIKKLQELTDKLYHQEQRYKTANQSEKYSIITNVEVLDITEVLRSYLKYVEQSHTCYSLLIKEVQDFRRWEFHTYDDYTNEIVVLPKGFNYIFNCSSVKNLRNLRHLFKDGRTPALSCRSEKIEIFINQILM